MHLKTRFFGPLDYSRGGRPSGRHVRFRPPGVRFRTGRQAAADPCESIAGAGCDRAPDAADGGRSRQAGDGEQPRDPGRADESTDQHAGRLAGTRGLRTGLLHDVQHAQQHPAAEQLHHRRQLDSDQRELQPGRRASTVRAVGRRPVHALDRWVEGDDERDRQPVQPAAVEQPQRQLRAAAAAELQVRREPAADRNQQEQRDHRRPRSARTDRDYDASGAQRLLRSDRGHRRPESRAVSRSTWRFNR